MAETGGFKVKHPARTYWNSATPQTLSIPAYLLLRELERMNPARSGQLQLAERVAAQGEETGAEVAEYLRQEEPA